MSKFTRAVQRGLEGLEHVSTGLVRGCEECGTPPEEESEDWPDEGCFSGSSCDSCNSHLAGDRYAAHAFTSERELIHLNICVDCLMFIANGDEPDRWEG